MGQDVNRGGAHFRWPQSTELQEEAITQSRTGSANSILLVGMSILTIRILLIKFADRKVRVFGWAIL